jgi:hypothetical protein
MITNKGLLLIKDFAPFALPAHDGFATFVHHLAPPPLSSILSTT